MVAFGRQTWRQKQCQTWHRIHQYLVNPMPYLASFFDAIFDVKKLSNLILSVIYQASAYLQLEGHIPKLRKQLQVVSEVILFNSCRGVVDKKPACHAVGPGFESHMRHWFDVRKGIRSIKCFTASIQDPLQ